MTYEVGPPEAAAHVNVKVVLLTDAARPLGALGGPPQAFPIVTITSFDGALDPLAPVARTRM